MQPSDSKRGEPTQGEWGLWYVEGQLAGFATKEKAEAYLRELDATHAAEAAVEAARANARQNQLRHKKILSKAPYFAWGFMAACAALAITVMVTVLNYFSSDDTPKAAKASPQEILECKERITQQYAQSGYKLDVHVLTGTSSDQLGPGGTSRVRMYFDLVSQDGTPESLVGICQFSADAAPLIVQRQAPR